VSTELPPPPPPPEVEKGPAAPVDPYQAIIETCRKSQEIMDKRLKEVGVDAALPETEPYQSMWQEYAERVKGPVRLVNADFSGLLFKGAKFREHQFLGCNFSGSRWVFSFIYDGDCAGSDFSGVRTLLSPFIRTNCTGCSFVGAEILYFEPFEPSIFENANFTNAKLLTAHSFFKEEKVASRARFENATMDGCKLIIQKEKQPQYNRTRRELQSILEKLFSPSQLAVMQVDYGVGGFPGCFIATAACGVNSEEVVVLRRFRDDVLLESRLGHILVKVYYNVSPFFASLIECSPTARMLARDLLTRPIAGLIKRKYEIEPERVG